MRSYCRLKTGLAGFLLIYLVMACVGLLFSPNKEIFPFFSWFLFSVVPNPGYHYNVDVVEHEKQSYDPPVPYNKAVGIVVYPKAIAAYQFIQKMGRAYEAGRMDDFEELNRLFQRNFLRGFNKYQLVKVYYDPVEQWHGKESPVEVLQTFQKTSPPP